MIQNSWSPVVKSRISSLSWSTIKVERRSLALIGTLQRTVHFWLIGIMREATAALATARAAQISVTRRNAETKEWAMAAWAAEEACACRPGGTSWAARRTGV